MIPLKKLFILAAALAPAVARADAPPLSLPDVIETARRENPDIRAARAAWQVRRHEVAPAGAWPNPTLTFENEQFPSGGAGPSEHIRHYRVDQTVPFPGKLSTDERMKRHEALIAESDYQAKEIGVLGDVRVRYFQLYLADQKIALAGNTVAALRSVLQTAQSRLASGQSSASDVFMAQMELRKMENRLFEEKQSRTLTEIELNTLLNRATDAPLGAAAAPEVVDLPAPLDALRAAARASSPQFRQASHERHHAEAMRLRGRLDYLPDVNLSYEREAVSDGPDGRQVGVGLSVPLWLSRPYGASAAAAAHVSEADAMAQDRENMVMKMVHMEFTEVTTHLTLARNYERDLLPTAQSNLRVAREQYASGRGDFLRVLEALRAWIETNNEYQDELYHYAEHWSLLERWVGTDLTKVKETSDAR